MNPTRENVLIFLVLFWGGWATWRFLLPHPSDDGTFAQATTTVSGGASRRGEFRKMLHPRRELYRNVDIHWQIPSNHLKGVLLVLHGCSRNGVDWFKFPEDVIITGRALEEGYAVVAPSSFDQDSKCWGEEDVMSLLMILNDFLGREALSRLPLYGIGVSSGGSFLAMICSMKEFQQKFSAISLYISPGLRSPSDYEQTFPPTIFVYMPKDHRWASTENIDAALARLEAVGVDGQKLACSPRPISLEYLEDSLPEVPTAGLAKFHEDLTYHNFLDKDGFLTDDPRQDNNWRVSFTQSLSNVGAPSPTEMEFASLEEILNVGWSNHEVSSEHIDEVLAFFGRHSLKK